MLLDEAFEKMDAQNVRATADYLNALGLQLVMAGPEADQAKMSSFLDVYYDMARYGSRTVQLTRNVVLDEARELLQSDNYLLHPELLEQLLTGYWKVFALMGVGFLLHFCPDSWQNACSRGMVRMPLIAQALIMIALIYLVIQVKSSDIQPFIYFQF